MSTVTETDSAQTITIKTAWDEYAINQAVANGFMPLIKPVTPCKKLEVTTIVYQHKTTGEVRVKNSNEVGMRDFFFMDDNWQQVLKKKHYPITHKAPFGAYLIPQNLKPDTVVWLEELIEDQVGQIHNGVATGRLDSCLAVWTGSDIELLDPVPLRSVG